MKVDGPELARVRQLLDKLEQRARSCRGLFPVSSPLEFLNLASDHQLQRLLPLEELSSLKTPDLQPISLCLERFWRDPSLCQQVLAQCLLRHQSVTLKTYQPGGSSRNTWLHVVQSGLQHHSETACQKQQLKSA